MQPGGVGCPENRVGRPPTGSWRPQRPRWVAAARPGGASGGWAARGGGAASAEPASVAAKHQGP